MARVQHLRTVREIAPPSTAAASGRQDLDSDCTVVRLELGRGTVLVGAVSTMRRSHVGAAASPTVVTLLSVSSTIFHCACVHPGASQAVCTLACTVGVQPRQRSEDCCFALCESPLANVVR